VAADERKPDPKDVEETGGEELFAYPDDHIVAIFRKRDEAVEAIKRLGEMGFTANEVETYQGETGAESIDSSGSEHGFFGSLIRHVEKVASNVGDMREYEEAAAQGHVVVAVHAPEEETRQQATDLLLSYDTRAVNFFGRLMVETLRD
jgi:hypothetical protein